jgi:hypothetical protein
VDHAGVVAPPPLKALLEWAEGPRLDDEAADVRSRANLRYQFVDGSVDEERARFVTHDGSILDLDLSSRALRGRIRREVITAPYSTWPDLVASPLAELWRSDGCFPLHAGAVEIEGRTALVPGGSGSGKTTLALALIWHAEGRWRADDKVLVREGAGRTVARSLYRNANVHPRSAVLHPDPAFLLTRPPLDATNEKRSVDLGELHPTAVDLSAFEPDLLVFPEVAGERSGIVRLSRTEAFLRLAANSPSSPCARRRSDQARLLAGIARALPAWTARLGPDLLAEPRSIAAGLVSGLLASLDFS